MNVKISFNDGRLYIQFPFSQLDLVKAKAIPERRWNKTAKAWTCSPTLSNIKYLEDAWSRAEWSAEADAQRREVYERLQRRQAVIESKQGVIDTSVLNGVPFKKIPFEHQKIALCLGRDQDNFAYLMDQGTGKTKTLIDDAAHNWRENKIDVVLLFTINSVKTNWVIFDCMKDDRGDTDAIDDHMPPDVPCVKGVWLSKQSGPVGAAWNKFERDITEQITRRDKLVFLAANIESLRVDRAYDFYERICSVFQGKVMIAIDESTLIGQPGSKQTKASMKLRKLCSKARIMSGTPVIKSPLKAYSQFCFLDEDILGFGSFYSFRNHYAVMGGYENKKVLFFRHLEELQEKISSCSYRVLKEECLDLPPQLFTKRRVEMTPAQAKAYKSMQDEFIAENENSGIVEASIVLTQMLRLQQITGGYLPIINDDDETIGYTPLVEPEKNPKFREILNILEEGGDQRMLIWTRFTHEILDLTKLLNEKGFPTLSFYGGISDEEKISVRKRFARNDDIRCIVGNPAAGGLGIDEFKHASLVAYITNSFDTERRKQSEDRTHRIGSEMHSKITYCDIIIPNTIDIKILQTMRNNVKIASAVMNDEWREWI